MRNVEAIRGTVEHNVVEAAIAGYRKTLGYFETWSFGGGA
jgi:hypothetical protein